MNKHTLFHSIIHELNKAGYNVSYYDHDFSYGYGIHPILNTACYFQSGDVDDLDRAYICPVLFMKKPSRFNDDPDYYVSGDAGHRSRLNITKLSAEHIAQLISNMALTSYTDFVIPEGTSSPYYTSLLTHVDTFPKRSTCTMYPNKQPVQCNTVELIKLNLR